MHSSHLSALIDLMGFSPLSFLLSLKAVALLDLYIPHVNPSSNLSSQEKAFITPEGTVSGGKARRLAQRRMSYASISTVTRIPSSSASSSKVPAFAI
jgi:hypothetical protein